MTPSAILIETTVLIDLLRRSVAAAEYLDHARATMNLVCSAVTKAELIVGARTRAEVRAIEQLIDRFDVEHITAVDSSRALKWLGKYFHSHGAGFHDCLLEAAALRLRIPIVTLNEKHFQVLPGIKVIRPY